MSELAIFQAELDRLEREDRWDDPGYDFLAQRVEELKAAEQSKPQAPQAPATSGHPEPDLASRMLAMQRNPERFSDAQHEAIVAEFNKEVMAAIGADQPQPERVDVQALVREMTVAGADPNVTDEQRADLLRRYNAAIRQGDQRTTAELRAELSSADLGTRMLAAAALDDRGELSDEQAAAAVAAYQGAVAETTAAIEAAGGIDVAALPEQLRPAAEAILKAKADLEVPPDPVDAALHQLRQAMRSMKAPSLEQQLAALGVEADPELGVQAEPQPEPAQEA